MSRKKNEMYTRLIVGVFMIVVIVLLGYFTIIISGGDVFSGGARVGMRVAFENVGGLKDHDSVMYRGTKVGIVERVQVTPTNLLVRIEVDANVVLRESYRIAVCNLSMLGGNYLLLEEGAGKVLDPAKVTFAGETPTDWMRDVSKIAKTMNELVNRPEMHEIVTNVAAASAKSRRISERVDDILERLQRNEGLIGRLLAPDTAVVYDEVANTVSNVDEIVCRVSRGEGVAGRLLSSDDRLYEDLRASVDAFRKACESFDMGNARDDIRKLAEKGNVLADNLNVVAERLKKGEGTAGRLMRDEGLYKELDGLIRDCRQIIDNYRDTTPISTFTSLATGAL